MATLDRSQHAVPESVVRLRSFQERYPLGSKGGSKVKEGESKVELFALPSVFHSSRHFPGPFCPAGQLEKRTSDFSSREYGSLYQVANNVSSEASESDEEQHVFSLREEVLYLIRGHAVNVPGSYLLRQAELFPTKDAGTDAVCIENSYFAALTQHQKDTERDPYSDPSSAKGHLQAMVKLLERLEEEASLYWERKHRSSVALATEAPDQADPGALDPDAGADASRGEFGAPPGPSVEMYDLVLDAHASVMKSLGSVGAQDVDAETLLDLIGGAKAVQQRAITRYQDDGTAANTNPHTLLTPMTWNAPLAMLSFVPYSHGANAELRDAAIDMAFGIYDSLERLSRVDRSQTKNAATCRYLLSVTNRFIPDSRSKANIAYGIFAGSATEQKIVDASVWHVVMDEFDAEANGPDWKDFIRRSKAENLPQTKKEWGENVEDARYRTWDDASY